MSVFQMSLLPVLRRAANGEPAACARRLLLAVGGIVACSATTGCDLPTWLGHEGPIGYSVESLEVVEEAHDWATEVVKYLRADVLAVNVSDAPVTLTRSSCILDLEAWPTAVPEADAPTWRMLRRRSWPGSIGSACGDFFLPTTLAPGDTLRKLNAKVRLAEILADSLPVGMYRFAVRMNNRIATHTSTWTEDRRVELGTAYLPESRFPLSVDYPRDGFHYRVTISEAAGADVLATAILEVEYSAPGRVGPLTRDLSATCPVRLLAFPSVAERETIPVPEALWTWPEPSTCEPAAMPVTLGHGEGQTFDIDVPSHVPGANGQGIEHLAFMAIVDVEGRPIRLAVDPGPSGVNRR